MQTLKLSLLDYKAPSVTNLLSLYQRIQESCVNDGTLQDLEVQLSSTQRQLIIEEIADVYLGYLYDFSIKKKVIVSMVNEVWNTNDQESKLDAVVIADYICELGREYGVSGQSCFFGRVALPRHGDVATDDGEGGRRISKFVYTGSTVRFLEQIAAAVVVEQPVLLVGETGTGKTTVVQELASTLGKKLHVFNMNQNTDSADLLGGFKPVDLKYLLKPIYGKFRDAFCTMLNPDTTNNKQFLSLLQKCFEQNKIHDFIKCL